MSLITKKFPNQVLGMDEITPYCLEFFNWVFALA